MEGRFLTKQFKLVGLEEKINMNEDFTEIILSLQKRLFNEINNVKDISSYSSYVAYWYYKVDQCSTEPKADIYYFAGVEVTDLVEVPSGLISKVIPKSEYVVFKEKRRGEIGGPEGYAYKEWLPHSGREFNDEVAGDFEVYQSRDNIGPECECEIYIPIK